MCRKLLIILLILSFISCNVTKKNNASENIPDTALKSGSNKFSTDLNSMKMMNMKLADVYYFYGQETIAKMYYDAFEKSVKYMQKNLYKIDPGRYRIYVYDSHENFVKGAMKFSNFNEETASFFKTHPPSPVNNVYHIPFFCSNKTVAHEFTHEFLRLYAGGSSPKGHWLNEGLSEYFSFDFIKNTKEFRQDYPDLKKNVLRYFSMNKKNYIPLETVLTFPQWKNEIETGNISIIYNEAFISTLYLINKYGIKKIKELFRNIQTIQNIDDEIKKELNITMKDIYDQVIKLNENDIIKLL